MRYLFFTNTPAHVHLYKHAVRRLTDAGHEVLILARDYGCTIDLLDYYELPYAMYGSCKPSKYSLFRRLPGHYARIFRYARRFDPDLIFGLGSYAAHGSLFCRTQCILILDSEPTTLDHLASRPFADVILTPSSFRKHLGRKHYEFDGFKECAYLHPEVFSADPCVRDELGLDDDEPFVLLRFNAFGSHHDLGHSGFPPERREELVDQLSSHATVFVSDEAGTFDFYSSAARPYDIHPARLHDALSEARLLVADTQTMVTESALLGTPAVRSNSFVGERDMGNFHTLEEAGLIVNTPSFDDALSVATELVSDPTVKAVWRERRDAFIGDKTNLTEVIVDIATSRGRVDTIGEVMPRISNIPG